MNMGTRLLYRLVMPTYSVLYRTQAYNLIPIIESFNHTRTFTISPVINYAKNKDRGKDKNKGGKVTIDTRMMSELVPVAKMRDRCNAAVEKMKDEFVQNLSLRSSTGAIETITVKFEGKEYELQELAQIVKKNPKTLVINFSSFPQAIPNALKAINASGLNLNPQQDGTTLFVPVPKVTKEHRESLARNAKIMYIICRDSISSIQNEYIKTAKKQTGVSEDLIFSVQRQISAFGDEFKIQARNIYDIKCKELLGEK